MKRILYLFQADFRNMLKSRKRPKTLKADHPFIFCLREESNTFFIGRVNDLPKSLLPDFEDQTTPLREEAIEPDWSDLVDLAK